MQLLLLSDSYKSYCSGLRDAVKLLMVLREYDEFEAFLKVRSRSKGQVQGHEIV